MTEGKPVSPVFIERIRWKRGDIHITPPPPLTPEAERRSRDAGRA